MQEIAMHSEGLTIVSSAHILTCNKPFAAWNKKGDAEIEWSSRLASLTGKRTEEAGAAYHKGIVCHGQDVALHLNTLHHVLAYEIGLPHDLHDQRGVHQRCLGMDVIRTTLQVGCDVKAWMRAATC